MIEIVENTKAEFLRIKGTGNRISGNRGELNESEFQ